jgi:hypothetical protein
MDIEEIAFELELAGLSMDERRMLLSSIRRSGFDPKALDNKLKAMGYAPIFTIYDEESIHTTRR